jgi:rhamnopyranosyl-N-acetylglucosaminyl-diphospho-decaprenol beta-1,3/1,4-galactofuranosyltransferase
MSAVDADRRRVAAVVLARDRPAVLERTLGAILAQKCPPDVLIVVGNDPTPEVREILERITGAHEDGRALVLAHNLGAAGGFHAGIAYALSRGDLDYVCCFDDDAMPLPGCLRALRSAAAGLPRVGSIGALTHDESDRLSWPLHVVDEDHVLEDAGAARDLAARRGALPVYGMCWHALMLPTSVLREQGNVWAELFHQYEDAELGLRLRAAGLENYLVTEAECLHPRGPDVHELRLFGYAVRVSRQSPAMEYLTLRNDLVVRRRYNGVRFWYGTLPLILLRGLLIALQLGVPRWTALRHVYLRAIVDACRMRLGPPPRRLYTLGIGVRGSRA